MKVLNFLRDTLLNYVFVFVVYVVVTYLYNQIVHGTTMINWDDILKYTVIFGTIFTAIKLFDKRKKK